jgi:hypothetical protein
MLEIEHQLHHHCHARPHRSRWTVHVVSCTTGSDAELRHGALAWFTCSRTIEESGPISIANVLPSGA